MVVGMRIPGAVGLEGQTMALRAYLATPRSPRLVILGAAVLLPGEISDPASETTAPAEPKAADAAPSIQKTA